MVFDLQVGHILEEFHNSCYQQASAFWNSSILPVRRKHRGLNEHSLGTSYWTANVAVKPDELLHFKTHVGYENIT